MEGEDNLGKEINVYEDNKKTSTLCLRSSSGYFKMASKTNPRKLTCVIMLERKELIDSLE